MRRTIRFRFRKEDGQAFVEFAIVLPLFVLLFMGILHFGQAFRNYIAITDAARVAARAAAVEKNDPCGVARTAIQNTVSAAQWGVVSSRITCTAGTYGNPVKVSIEYPNKIVGLPGITTGEMWLTARASATDRMETSP